ncbi:glycosyltransferase family 2 protein [Actinocorallia sp. API 0066]|uniref:glycosyltransferase family 2 protein n=1 Tax=Actinocorallia sp. API 0066 TaxID=2896846 RepID=UPI001E46AF39|nr:glycosyltransferase family 2 protein [Actinocorallia sp. API 0066]MCD0453758.1 glycosyltransferase family 2 protein [Actinocorallia sp. API 0066]
MTLSFVVLTMGNRPVELDRSLRSALDQKGVDAEIVLVGNGVPGDWEPPVADPRVRVFRLPENLGVPAGRNFGVAEAKGDIVVFLDDDGYYPSLDLGRRLETMFAADPKLGIVSFQVRDPEGGPAQRRHVPRLRAGDPDRSSEVTTFLGGASAMRRSAFDAGGGLPENFFFAHEETDLAWQAINAGYKIVYDAESVMCHPATLPTRHASFYRYNARNRVWLAKRNLPWPIAITYLAVWATMTVLRERSPEALKPWFRGFAEGWQTNAGPRRPISWRTAWRMTRAGRPPII